MKWGYFLFFFFLVSKLFNSTWYLHLPTSTCTINLTTKARTHRSKPPFFFVYLYWDLNLKPHDYQLLYRPLGHTQVPLTWKYLSIFLMFYFTMAKLLINPSFKLTGLSYIIGLLDIFNYRDILIKFVNVLYWFECLCFLLWDNHLINA